MGTRTLVMVTTILPDGRQQGAILWTYAEGGSAIEALIANRVDGTRSMPSRPTGSRPRETSACLGSTAGSSSARTALQHGAVAGAANA